ncbi:MAG TPA: hypothetical protein VHC49_22855, partial [Mycobacteriales bacterium]|nr:hypothetical protein [Mycobacteriales bacterium]
RDTVIPRPAVTIRHGLMVLQPRLALLGAWAILPPARRRAPVIDAVRLGLVHPDQIGLAIQATPT